MEQNKNVNLKHGLNLELFLNSLSQPVVLVVGTEDLGDKCEEGGVGDGGLLAKQERLVPEELGECLEKTRKRVCCLFLTSLVPAFMVPLCSQLRSTQVTASCKAGLNRACLRHGGSPRKSLDRPPANNSMQHAPFTKILLQILLGI